MPHKIKFKKEVLEKTKNKEKIRVLYKRVGQVPKIKIINNVLKLEKAVVYKKLDIIPYQNIYIICHNKEIRKNMPINVVFDMFNISGDFIVVQINKNKRKFEGLFQEDINWFAEDLINKSFNYSTNKNNFNTKKISNSFVREIEEDTEEKFNNSNFENSLINILTNIEIDLKKLNKKKK